LELCKQRIVQTGHSDFLPCKEAVDAMYRCYTEDKYGDEYHDTIPEAKSNAYNFLNCYFHKYSSLTECMMFFEDSIRQIYRLKDTKLIDYY